MSIVGWVWAIVIGAVVGYLAKLLLPGRDPGGLIITILIGIGGSLVASFAGKALGIYSPGDAAGFFGSLLGAIAILAVYRVARR